MKKSKKRNRMHAVMVMIGFRFVLGPTGWMFHIPAHLQTERGYIAKGAWPHRWQAVYAARKTLMVDMKEWKNAGR